MNRAQFQKELESSEYQEEFKRHVDIKNSLLYCLMTCFLNANRDGVSGERNFFLRMIDDITQSSMAIEALAENGIVNTCRREFRYLVELSIKSCLITENTEKRSFEEQIDEYEKLLNSSNINPINSLTFGYLGAEHEEAFKTEVKRLYGRLCKYTHSSVHQIRERLDRAQNGKTIGFEGIQELKALNEDMERVYAIVIVMIFHSVAEYVVGDFLVEPDGGRVNWYFRKSKYINIIDQNFDYKHQRQRILEKLKAEREEDETF